MARIQSSFYHRCLRLRSCCFVWIVFMFIFCPLFILTYKRRCEYQSVEETNEQVPFGEDYTLDLLSVNLPKAEKVTVETSRQNVLINSYMSSGSTFLGQALGFRNDSFYFFEPLFSFGTGKFYASPDIECGVHTTCRKITSTQLNYKPRTMYEIKHHSKEQYFGKDDFSVVDIKKFYQKEVRYDTPIDVLLDVLTDIYKCDFSRISNLVYSRMHPSIYIGGPSWAIYRDCITQAPHYKGKCMQRLEETCKAADHVVTKVLRMTTGSLEKLLERFDNLKVIHLYRDPRAVINSRMNWQLYPKGNMFQDCRILCEKMLVDLLGGIKIAGTFKNRLKFVFYEDIKSDTSGKMNLLYDYLGMKHVTVNTDTNLRLVNDKSDRDRVEVRRKDNAYWWRYSVLYNVVNLVHSQCRDIVLIFNMTHFNDVHSLQNHSIPSIVLPDFFKLL